MSMTGIIVDIVQSAISLIFGLGELITILDIFGSPNVSNVIRLGGCLFRIDRLGRKCSAVSFGISSSSVGSPSAMEMSMAQPSKEMELSELTS